MSTVLVGTTRGCRIFTAQGEGETAFPNRMILAMTHDNEGGCLAAVDGKEIWKRSPHGVWSKVVETDACLQAIAVDKSGSIYGGAMPDASIVKIARGQNAERLVGFDNVDGRQTWFGEGPPLHVRALTTTSDGAIVLAAVHVGGIVRSTDGGITWTPTVPIKYDIHEVASHPTIPNIVAAAAGVGLCTSTDGGNTWTLITEGLDPVDSLAIAVLPDEILFSIQTGPFAKRSQLWRRSVAGGPVERVADGLPEWFDGKIDTGHIAANASGHAAVLDRGGNLWVSQTGTKDWHRIGSELSDTISILHL